MLVCDVFIVVGAVKVWYNVKQFLPPAEQTVRVISQQWPWTFVHPGADGEIDTAADIITVDELRLQTGTTYHYKLESRDVLHSFSIPVFRLKQDAIPGRVITGWFEPTKTGTFDVQCTIPAALLALVPSLLSTVIDEAKEVVDRVVPDKEGARAAKAALDDKKQDQTTQLALQQILTNVAEIQSGHILGKWRGALGWGLALSAIYQLILVHFITFIALSISPTYPVEKLPKLDWQELGKLLLGMLGIV